MNRYLLWYIKAGAMVVVAIENKKVNSEHLTSRS